MNTKNQVMMEIEANKPEVGGGGGIHVGLSPLSETLWREKSHNDFIGDASARLTWKDLTVMVTLNNGSTQKVLEGLNGYAEPGTFTALMGPSGSGKSTLLDALSSRLAANAFLSGTILLNGRKTKLSFGTAVNRSKGVQREGKRETEMEESNKQRQERRSHGVPKAKSKGFLERRAYDDLKVSAETERPRTPFERRSKTFGKWKNS